MKATFTYWQDGEQFVGFLDDYPDYPTQGETLEDLKEHLIDLFKDLSTDAIPGVRHRGELVIA
jgi:hypothetical protein